MPETRFGARHRVFRWRLPLPRHAAERIAWGPEHSAGRRRRRRRQPLGATLQSSAAFGVAHEACGKSLFCPQRPGDHGYEQRHSAATCHRSALPSPHLAPKPRPLPPPPPPPHLNPRADNHTSTTQLSRCGNSPSSWRCWSPGVHSWGPARLPLCPSPCLTTNLDHAL